MRDKVDPANQRGGCRQGEHGHFVTGGLAQDGITLRFAILTRKMPDEGIISLHHISFRENNLFEYGCRRSVTVGLHTQFSRVGIVQLPSGHYGQLAFFIYTGKMPLQISQFIGSNADTVFRVVFFAGYKCQYAQQKEYKSKNAFFHNNDYCTVKNLEYWVVPLGLYAPYPKR